MANFTVTEILSTVSKSVAQVSFSWYDYVFFCAMLGLSALIGIYFGCFGTKQATADEYLMGNKKMKLFPISVSLTASHMSGITLLAIPADVYRYGASYLLVPVSVVMVSACTIYIFLPVFFKLQVTSTYEYLERRFDHTNRIFGSFLFTLGLFLYLPIVIYIPALALSAATGINVRYIAPMVCGVCIFYTTLGGLRAVVWTDTLQYVITAGAVFTVGVIGLRAGGGFGAIWSIALGGHRLDIFDFNPDFTLRDSFWITIMGMFFYWTSIVGIHQSCVQKYLSLSTLREAKLSVVYFSIGFTIISLTCIFIGLMMYARYATCDPFTIGAVRKNDQLVPYYIMDVASHVPGLSGLYIAGIFCAALSTLSASLNCMAGTIFEDFIVKITGPIFDERKSTHILKIIVVITGVLCTALVFVIEHLGGLLPLALSLGGITAGPLLGMFTLGVLFPKASRKGTLYGAIIGLVFSGWIVAMAQYYRSQGLLADMNRPTSIEGCLVNATEAHVNELFTTLEDLQTERIYTKNHTDIFFDTFSTSLPAHNITIKNRLEKSDKPFALFRISHYYYSPLATVVTIICGLLISVVLKNDDPAVHPDLLSPVIYFMLSKEAKDIKIKDYSNIDKALEMVTLNTEKEQNEKAKV